jgi:hypothetical protein
MQQLVIHDLARAYEPVQHSLVQDRPQLRRLGTVKDALPLDAGTD